MISARAEARALSLRWVALFPRHASFSKRATIRNVTRATTTSSESTQWWEKSRKGPATAQMRTIPREIRKKGGRATTFDVVSAARSNHVVSWLTSEAAVGRSSGMRRLLPNRAASIPLGEHRPPGGRQTRAATSPTAWTARRTRMPPPRTV